ncbi:small integral membrane protein [Synechococcus sp. PCC 7502]|uniref:TMEM14 family protein n=1 Tax=Synechococcus sp. PCC 7502 TaxID=1173263 RepID=UPI00029FF120|nr:TMEM14 family protein [Synechococcus sp. PCC 7502]AFY73061.1 small integral membrane protein [Synechococcus sp. PCC 7502]
MNLSVIATIAYGVLAIAGGVMGYVKSQSQASLISGIISGALLLVASIVQLSGQDWGKYLVVAIAAALVVVFIVRLAKTQKFMPAGIMIIAGVATLGAVLL